MLIYMNINYSTKIGEEFYVKFWHTGARSVQTNEKAISVRGGEA
jgi:hypothetical protein